MARSLQEYQTHWQDITAQGNVLTTVEEEDLTNEMCAIFESGGTSPMDEGMLPFQDFGDAICYYRYYRLPDELEPSGSRSKPSDDDLQARLKTATQVLDSLLEEFLQQGYQADMANRLQEVVNQAAPRLHIFEVYVLPGDMDALLHAVGNPLVNYDAYETEEEAEAHATVFDMSNPEHRAALKEQIFMVGR